MMTVRSITADDMPLLQGWAKKRGCFLSPEILSPHGMLAELDNKPLMCAWAAMILDTPFIEVDHVYASPRVTKKTGVSAWAALIAFFRSWMHQINEAGGQQVTAIKIAMNAQMSPYAKKTGGNVGNMPLLNCIYTLKEVSHGA